MSLSDKEKKIIHLSVGLVESGTGLNFTNGGKRVVDRLILVAEKNDLDVMKWAQEYFTLGDLSHDIMGIYAHSTEDGELTDCFWPRCGEKKAKRVEPLELKDNKYAFLKLPEDKS